MLPPRPDVKEKRHQIPRQREMYMPLHSKKDKFRDTPLQTFTKTKYFNSRTVILMALLQLTNKRYHDPERKEQYT